MGNVIDAAVKCLKDEAQALLDVVPKIGADFEHAVELILNSKGKLVVTGVGKSGHVGMKIAATMASLGTPAFFMNSLDAYHGDLGMIEPDDIILAISYSGNTDELLRFIPLLLDRHIPIIGMSGNPKSLLAQYSNCFLDISVEHEADHLNLAPTSSTTVTMALGDALACVLAQLKNFKDSDFAKFHPGGSLGKRLLSKVGDFMVKTDLPIVSLDSKVCDTIIQISKTKQGIAVALVNGKIAGVVTDGDVRRAMQTRQEDFFSLCVKDIMSINPKTINSSAKLTEAADVMRHYNIHSLIVVDDKENFVGLIDSFSCL